MSLADRIRLGAVPKRGMCSTAPAKDRGNALLSGNGNMTVNVLGDPFAEQLMFSRQRLQRPWKDNKPMEAPKIADVLPEVQRLIMAGDSWRAQEVYLDAAYKSNTPPSTSGGPGSASPFTMRIDMRDRHAVTDYLRTTDFESGEVKVTWKESAGVWVRRTFVSRPDNVAVLQMTAPSGGSINATIQLQTAGGPGPGAGGRGTGGGGGRGLVPAGQRRQVTRIADSVGTPTVCDDQPWCRAPLSTTLPGANETVYERSFDPTHLILTGRFVVPGTNPGYASVTRVISNGGSATVENEALVLNGVRSVTLLTRIEPEKELTVAEVDKLKAAVDQVSTDYDQLMARHRPGQAEVMDRVTLDFGGGSAHFMSGEEMLVDQQTRVGFNPALLEGLFNMGRYWLYSGTGERPPAAGETNINVNLDTSGMVEGNLPETVKAYTQWMEALLPDARQNAKNIFGTRGVFYPLMPGADIGPALHFVYIWGPHIYWTAAAGWLFNPMWEYYQATGDKAYLRDHLLPLYKEAALFYEDFLTHKDENGKFIFVPSYSPENWPNNSSEAAIVMNATMDIGVCTEVLKNVIEAAKTLGTDLDKIPKWQSMLDNMPPYLAETNGALKEWAWPAYTENLDHRHLSHLYPVWPGNEITVDGTPELARAALIAIRERAQGNASVHGPAHRALAAVRLKDADLLNWELKQLLEMGYVFPALTTYHNPYTATLPDLQGSLPTIMMEMLVYSRPGVMELLPASPDSLARGNAKGIVSHTQATIDNLTWDLSAHTVDVTINSRVNQNVKMFLRKGIESVDAPAGVLAGPVTKGAIECELRLPASRPVTLHFKIGDLSRQAWVVKLGE